MAVDQSVKRFQELMAALPEGVKTPIRQETFRQAALLAGQMKIVVPVGKGTLRDSIRVEESGRNPMRALVRAGGPATTVHGYDYALATEFGTANTPAQPFFWPSYRASKVRIRRAIRRAAKDAISTMVPLR